MDPWLSPLQKKVMGDEAAGAPAIFAAKLIRAMHEAGACFMLPKGLGVRMYDGNTLERSRGGRARPSGRRDTSIYMLGP